MPQDQNYSFLTAFGRQLSEALEEQAIGRALPPHVELALLRVRDGVGALLGHVSSESREDGGGLDEELEDEFPDGDASELERRRGEDHDDTPPAVITASRRALSGGGQPTLQRARPRRADARSVRKVKRGKK